MRPRHLKNAHIAFFPFPHTPHVNPTLPIVSTLVRRGHLVSYVTSSIFSEGAAAFGAQVISCPCFIEFSSNGAPSFRDTFLLSTHALSKASSFYEEFRPDLILYDRAFFAGRILANRFSVPAITTSPALAFNKADLTELSDSGRERREVEIQFTKKVDAFFHGHGIHEANSYFHEEPLNIYLYPRIYQLSGDVFGEDYFYAGRCAAERSYQGVWRPTNAAGRPIVLVSASTAYVPGPEFFKMCVSALTGSKWHVLLSLNGNFDPSTVGPLPPHCEVITGVPQIQILPYVHLLLCMGGPVTAAEAMYHGVPLLMMTHGIGDLEATADNAVRLGIGTHLRKPEMTAEIIRDSAARILGDITLAARVRQVECIVKQEPGAEETANRIEDYLGVNAD